MRHRQSSIFWAAVIFSSASVTGCAILTIDVDVYKGALVNEQHVQFHQLVALSSGTKPFLIQLRDELEWEIDGKSRPYPKWYQADYVPPPREVTKDNFFTKPHATRVNAILSFYCDVNSPSEDVALNVTRLNRILDRYEKARHTYEPSLQRDTAIYNNITKGLKNDEDLQSDILKRLKLAYKELLLPQETPNLPVRKVGNVMDTLKAASQVADASTTPFEASLLSNWTGTENYKLKHKDNIYQSLVPYKIAWKLLAAWDDSSLLAALTSQLCTSNDQGQTSCRLLVNRIKEIAESYWTLKNNTQELWQRTLELLVEIDLATPNECRRSKDSLIDLAMKLADVRRIGSALDRLSGAPILLKNVIFMEAQTPIEQWARSNESHAKDLLRQALVSSTFQTAKGLLTLDYMEKTTLPPTTDEFGQLVKAANTVHPSFSIRFGLTHGFLETGHTDKLQELITSAKDTQHYLAQGLEFGRQQEGLYTLTRHYFACVNTTRDAKAGEKGSAVKEAHEKDRCEEQEHDLLDGLIEFAQKISFLGNYENLISPDPIQGLISGGFGKLTRGLLGEKLTPNFLSMPSKQYTRVLQAVGNTIMFSANELREREKYRKAAVDKVQAEVRAVNLTHSPEPKKVLDGLLRELQAQKPKLSAAQNQYAKLQDSMSEIDRSLSDLQTKTLIKQAEFSAAQESQSQHVRENESLQSLSAVFSDDLYKTVRGEWNSKGNASTVSDFLTGSGGLAERLQAERTHHDDKFFRPALAYLNDSKAQDKFVDKLKQDSILMPASFVALLDVFAKYIKELEQNRKKEQANRDQVKSQAEQALKDIRISITKLTSEKESLKTQLHEANKVISELPSDLTRLDEAIQAVAHLTDNVRKHAESHEQFSSPTAVYSLLDTLLSQEEDKLSGSSKQPYQDAKKLLMHRVPPLGVLPLNSDDYKSPQSVIDELIALLRQRQIEAVERFGAGSDQDAKATKALEAAYQHRTRMLYIRPSSAYLRTSYPSTSLQSDPNLTYDNMLLQQGMSTLPFSSQVRDVLDPVVMQDRLLIAELDKQFWQNINRVRVAGTGFTNQAIVKDDVGNWYVKQYYGDTDKIFQSAAHLGLYSLGAKVPIDLAGQLKAASNPAEGDKVTASPSPPLTKVLEKHRTAYQTGTDEQLRTIEASHDKNIVRDEITKGFANIPELRDDDASQQALNNALTHAVRKWDQDIEGAKEKQGADHGMLLASEIRALYWFGKSLLNEIQLLDKDLGSNVNSKLSGLVKVMKDTIRVREEAEKASPSDMQDVQAKRAAEHRAEDAVQNERNRLLAVKAKAAREVNKTVGPLVLGMLKGRKQAIDNYEQALIFIGEAAKP